YRLKKFIFRFITEARKWVKTGRSHILKLYTAKDYGPPLTYIEQSGNTTCSSTAGSEEKCARPDHKTQKQHGSMLKKHRPSQKNSPPLRIHPTTRRESTESLCIFISESTKLKSCGF